ncbi:phosphonoacetaldehyde reductase [Zhouia amylolytica]|uniref:Uncharacterized protein n=1 Tax=Zhouia amylolytica AD3 TaxID=1286632 RepID=W2UK31_9FLAO|nr:phosphonoacetaldehyde reductase [Zhouia amylolytica]ETN94339.1 hypothetical protein P278_22810 [Zhouia amylolytica AD3]
MNQRLIEEISVKDIKRITNELGAKKVFLVTDPVAYTLSGAEDFFQPVLEDVEVTIFSDFEVNPKIEDVKKGVAIFKEGNYDLIIAIGGGSVIDMGKCINAFQANNPEDLLDFVSQNKIKEKGVPLLAIPTTSGSGSEATHFAVVYIDEVKYSLAHEYILPDIVGLNYRLTSTQPKYLTACTSLDALSQAIESYWSVGATEASKEYARKALSYLLPNIKKNVNSPTKDTRHKVSLGAYYAGKAINISKTTASHAVSYAFTTYYSIPHGHAVFLTLPEFFEYNYNVSEIDANNPKGIDYIKNSFEDLCEFLGVHSVTEGKNYLKELAREIGIELSLEKLNIKDCENVIADNVNTERLGNNPRNISKEQLLQLLRSKE